MFWLMAEKVFFIFLFFVASVKYLHIYTTVQIFDESCLNGQKDLSVNTGFRVKTLTQCDMKGKDLWTNEVKNISSQIQKQYL